MDFRMEVLLGEAAIYPAGSDDDGVDVQAPFSQDFDLEPAPKDGRIGSADKVAVAVGSATKRAYPAPASVSPISAVRVTALEFPIKVRHYYYKTNFTEVPLSEGEQYAAVVTETNKVTLAVYPPE